MTFVWSPSFAFIPEPPKISEFTSSPVLIFDEPPTYAPESAKEGPAKLVVWEKAFDVARRPAKAVLANSFLFIIFLF